MSIKSKLAGLIFDPYASYPGSTKDMIQLLKELEGRYVTKVEYGPAPIGMAIHFGDPEAQPLK